MNLVRKFGLWALAGALMAGAVAFYFFSARGVKIEEEKKQAEITTNLNALKTVANNDVKGDKWVEYARLQSEQWKKDLDRVLDLLAEQPRACQTRFFYDEEYADPGLPLTQVRRPNLWLPRYDQEKFDVLRRIQSNPAFSGIAFKPAEWQSRLPEPWEMQAAQTAFWFQRDMVNLLTFNEPNVIEKLRQRQNFERIKSLYDIVKNPHVSEPAAALFGISQTPEGERTLKEVLVDILTNPNGCDLRLILRGYKVEKPAKPEKPDKQEERYATIWDLVYDKTTEPEQRIFVDKLQGDWNSLITFIMDLRAVRYRADLLALFRRHINEEPKIGAIIAFLESSTTDKPEALIEEVKSWNKELVAQVIGYVISIESERDFDIILRNHRPPVVRTTFSTVGEGKTIELNAGIVDGQYIPIPFTLDVVIELEQLPIFLRRLFLSDWRIVVLDLKIRKEGAAAPTAADQPGGGGGGMAPGDLPPASAAPPPPREADVLDIHAKSQRVVTVFMKCEARLFFPLWKQRHPDKAKDDPAFVPLPPPTIGRPGGR